MKTSPLKFLLAIVLALSFTGCAAWNKYDLRQCKITAPAGVSAVAVACVDQRKSLWVGDIRPELIGVARSGVGVPYRVKTATKAPVAKEISEVVVRGFGKNRKLAPAKFYKDVASAKAALRGTGTDRQILVLIDRYNSDTLIRTELDYSIQLEVYDAHGRILATSTRTKIADLGGNLFLPAMHARQSVLRTTGQVLTELLTAPEIRAVLE